MGANVMADGLETELKLVASPAMLLQLRSHPLLAGEDEALTLVTRYFDTKDGALHRAGATLRLREGGAGAEQTFKSATKGKGSLRRGEWNAPATGALPDPAAFPPEPRRQIEALLGGETLQPLAVTRVARTARRLRHGGSTIEAAFDSGTVEAGGRSEPISELELELVEGRAADLFALAQQLPLGPEFGWSIESKGERGHALALDLPFALVRADDVALSPGMDVGQGFQAIAWNCLAHLLGNYREVVVSGDADALHQSRVAMRRLRAAFSLFGDRIAGEDAPVFRAEWKAAASGLGPARDLHVMIGRVEKAAAETGSEAGELLDRLRARRAAAMREAQALLAGKTFQHLLVRFAEWLEREAWRGGESGTGAPLLGFAEQTLGRRRRKLVKGKPLDALSDDALHALRIKGKKLRYAAEFFAALYPQADRAKARKAFGKALVTVQDCLGSVHDLAVAHDQREALFADLEPITAAGLSAQLAELLDRHGPGRKALVRAAARALDRVADAPAWWKVPLDGRNPTERATAD
jgi:inorganic triphosphatase YgiF